MLNKPEKVIESAYLAVSRKFEECLKVKGITSSTWRVIETLNESPGLTLKELSQQTDIKIPALSKLVDRLVRNALIHRKQSSVDRRSIQLFISDHGKDTLEKCLPEVRACRALLSEVLDSHTRTVLEKLEKIDQTPVVITPSSQE